MKSEIIEVIESHDEYTLSELLTAIDRAHNTLVSKGAKSDDIRFWLEEEDVGYYQPRIVAKFYAQAVK